MLPDDDSRLRPLPNCAPSTWWNTEFSSRGWRIMYQRCFFDKTDLPHPYRPWSHAHSWGRLLAVRDDRKRQRASSRR